MTASAVVPASGSWLLYQHPEYRAKLGRWVFALDHYSGDVLDPDRVVTYLPRKNQAETLEAYRERTALADYTPHFPAVVDSLAGMLFAVENDATRIWQDPDGAGGLGDPVDPDTIAGQLWDDADGTGSNWVTIWKRLVIELIVAHEAWVLVESGDGQPSVRILPATAVPNWRYDGDRLVDVVVCEDVDARTDVRSSPTTAKQYIHYEVGRWTRYRLDHRGQEVAVAGPQGSGVYAFTDRRDRPALPIYRVRLPLRRPVGWLLAKKANAIFNKESERDHLMRAAQLAIKLNLFGDDTLIEKLQKALTTGSAALQNPPDGKGHAFIAPSAEPAAIATDVLKRKVEEFYVVAFREYGDAARGGQQRTATEVRQDVASGVGAFLQLLKGAIDDAENEAFWRIEQSVFSKDRAKWFVGHVERSDDFAPVDPAVVIERLMGRYFMAKIPIGRAGRIAAARQAASWDGLPDDEAAVAAAVDAAEVQQQINVMRELPVGAEARIQLTLRWLESVGVLNAPGEVLTAADGTKTTFRAVVERQVREVAEAEQKAAVERSTFRFPGVEDEPPLT